MQIAFFLISFLFSILSAAQLTIDSAKAHLLYLQHNHLEISKEESKNSLDSIYTLLLHHPNDSLVAEYYYTKAKFESNHNNADVSLALLDSAFNKINPSTDIDLFNRISLDIGTNYLVNRKNEEAKTTFLGITQRDHVESNIKELAHTYLASLYIKTSQFDSCQFHLREFYSQFTFRAPHEDSTSYAYSRFLEGKSLRVQDSLEKSKEVLLHSVGIFQRQYPQVSHLYSYPLEELGSLSMNLGNNEDAIKYYEQAINVHENLKTSGTRNLFSVYNNLGSIYGRKGEIERSNIYKIKAKNMALDRFGPDFPELAAVFQGIALNFRKLGELEKAKEYLAEAKRIHSLKSPTNPRLIFVYNTEALIFRDLENYQEALSSYQKMEEIVRLRFGPDHSFMASLNNGRGQIYRQKKDYMRALPYYENALRIYQKIRGKSHPGNMLYLNNISSTHLELKNFEMAIQSLHQSLDISLALNRDQLKGSPIDSRDALFGMGKVFYDWYLHDPRDERLDSSFFYFQEGIRVMDDIRENSEGSLLANLTQEYAFDFLGIYNEVCSAIDEKRGTDKRSLAFQTLEKYRVMDLRAQYLQEYENVDSNIDAGDIVNQISLNRKKLSKLLSERENTVTHLEGEIFKKQTLEDSIFSFQLLQDSLTDLYKSIDPNGYALRYNLGVQSINNIQEELLDGGDAIIQFQWHETNLYTYIITSQNFKFFKSPISKSLAIQIELLLSAIENRRDIAELQKTIGDLLLDKALDLLGPNIVHLIIIPDGKIHLIPIEILRPAFIDHKMVIEEYDVSHAISASLLLHQTKSSTKEGKVLSVAPTYPEYPGENLSTLTAELVRSGELQLPYASKEVQAIEYKTGGHLLMGSKATKDHFLKIADNFSVLHLAMHAILIDENPTSSHLLFPPIDSNHHALFMHEISNYKMDKEMVVLSACNTTLGTVHNGDGIKGLSYAFYQSGTRSTISSLWKVPDRATEEIMTHFYHHLGNGQSKSMALKQAKLDYLSSVKTELERHPYYWAGFILTGSNTALSFKKNDAFLIEMGILTVLLLLIISVVIFTIKKRSRYIDRPGL